MTKSLRCIIRRHLQKRGVLVVTTIWRNTKDVLYTFRVFRLAFPGHVFCVNPSLLRRRVNDYSQPSTLLTHSCITSVMCYYTRNQNSPFIVRYARHSTKLRRARRPYISVSHRSLCGLSAKSVPQIDTLFYVRRRNTCINIPYIYSLYYVQQLFRNVPLWMIQFEANSVLGRSSAKQTDREAPNTTTLLISTRYAKFLRKIEICSHRQDWSMASNWII